VPSQPPPTQAENFSDVVRTVGPTAFVLTFAALNFFGFPEVEAGEVILVTAVGEHGLTALRFLDGIAGEPIITRLLLSTKAATVAAAAAGATYGIAAPHCN
jgi:hypothetical protein